MNQGSPRPDRRLAYRREDMPRPKLKRIAANRMAAAHKHLDVLMDERDAAATATKRSPRISRNS
ncbi:MAG: hypothetical protein FJX46_16525 [Alphaproteobacteria bacterium]|nr:hypothetical protein [Alphaproteobacteria bacterium]